MRVADVGGGRSFAYVTAVAEIPLDAVQRDA